MVFSTPCLRGVLSLLSKAFALPVGIIGYLLLWCFLCFIISRPTPDSGGMVLVFTIITCGIYGWYWLYKMGDRCDRIKGMNGSSGILYLILGIFGLSIVSYCLIQDTINKAIGA